MRFLLFFGILSFAFNSVNAQQTLFKDSLITNHNYSFNVPKAKFLYETEKGLVYELPLDKMRCLVPTFRSNMPVYKGFPQEIIPNAQQKIIPVPIPNPMPKTDIIVTPIMPGK